MSRPKRLIHAHENPLQRVLLLQELGRGWSRTARKIYYKPEQQKLQQEAAILYDLARRECISYRIAINPPTETFGSYSAAKKARG